MTPDFLIRANGEDITATIRDRLLSFRLTDVAELSSDDVELVLDDRDSMIVLPTTGAELEVALGYQETGLVRMGRFFVDEVEISGPPSTLTIRAKAVDFVAAMQTQKTRAWQDMTLGDIVAAIASEHRYEAVVAKQLGKIALPHVAQTAESDLNLLVRLAEEHGAVLKPMSTRLCFVKKGAAEKASGEAMPVLDLSLGDVTSWRVSLTTRDQAKSVRARWHDRSRADTLSLVVGHGEPVFEITHIHDSEAAARNAAEGKLGELQRSASTVSLGLPGNPEASAERIMRLSGFRDGANGDWICRRVEHALSDTGFTTQIDGEAAASSG